MAGTITHHIVAKRILNKGNYSNEFKKAFMFGTHGGDFLFFNETPLHLGHALHIANGKLLFNDYDKLLLNKSDYYKGYAYGLMAHYFIDRYVHQYVNYLEDLDKYPGRHALVEAQFDTVTYKDEYNETINNLDFKSEYIYNEEMFHEITKFYQDIKFNDSLTFSYISDSWKLMIKRTNMMLKPNKLLLFLIRIYEKLFNKGTFYSSHFFTEKLNTKENMNFDHKTWKSLYGDDTHSFYEIVEIGINDYFNEVKKIEYAIKNNTKYEFDYKENFDGRLINE